MDGALSSSRYDGGGSGSGGGGSGGGGGHYGGGGRHYGGGGRRYRGGGGRGGGGGGYHGRRHHPYNSGNRRNRGPRPAGNRYGASGASTKSVDPQQAMMQQLAAMVSRVGEYKEGLPDDGADNDAESSPMRPAVAAVAKNITDLCAVLCTESNAGLFLKFEAPTSEDDPSASSQINAKQEAGHLAHLVVSCVSSLPLETPTYAGLTLAVNQKAPAPDYAGFASRCVTYAMRILSRDLDDVLLNNVKGVVLTRIQHVLRYLALLGKLNIVAGYASNEKESVGGLLQTLVTAAVQAATLGNKDAACILAHAVLSTIPYTLDYLPSTFIVEQLVEPLETSVLNSSVYTSTFWPGIGKSALLLKQEQVEGDEDEEDDDEEDEEEESPAGQRCDTLQDLHRAVKTLLQDTEQSKATKFTLLSDAPWLGLKSEAASTETAMTDSAEDAAETTEALLQEPLVYTDEPLTVEFSDDCRSIPYLLNAAHNADDNDTELHCVGLEGIVFGRLPIFGAPSQDDDEEEEDEEEEEGGMQTAPNEQLQSYQKNFGLLDRFFLADAVRDCLLNHKSTVSDSGLERGSAKDTAQQVLAVSHVFSSKGDYGVEYGIIETIFSLLLQSSAGSLRHVYLSKVLLELTRLQPSVMPQALVVAVSNLFQDYLPSLVPSARESFSAWFAFHLTNTDYQWPTGYWELWTPYVTSDRRNSRGEFVVRALEIMASGMSSVSTLCTNCLPVGSVLTESLLGTQSIQDGEKVSSIQKDLEGRLWAQNEDPDTARAYMVGDEAAETFVGENSSSSSDSKWWRTRIVVGALLCPATRQRERIAASIKRAKEQPQGNENDMVVEEQEVDSRDALTDLTDLLVRYRPVLLATLARDAQDYDANQGETNNKESEVLVEGESILLKQVQGMTSHSRVLMAQCITCLLQQKIVSSLAVLRWALGDIDGATQQENMVVQRWWDLAVMTLRVGIAVKLADSDSTDLNMVIDNTGDDSQMDDPSTKLMKELVEYATPLLQYALQQVCRVLASIASQEGKKGHSPVEVDLIEGMKRFVVESHSLILSESRKRVDDSTSAKENALIASLSESDISGAKLASICRSDDWDSATADMLAQILENL